MKFLHIADVHLGCTRYNLPESPGDFFKAWMDVLNKYGVEEKVDFVIICGDFFHKKAVPPETLEHAVEGLTMLKEKKIPVIAIEGNHDQRATDSHFSWLRSLAKWDLLILLEPLRSEESKFTYEEWDPVIKKGGYYDIGRARIFGSNWYGASGSVAIPMLVSALKEKRREDGFNLLMLHTDVEGHQMHPLPGLPIASLRELRTSVDYIGLGHTHKHYIIDDWAFNPGSIEVTNIAEFQEERGALIIEVDKKNKISSRHVTDYHHRPFKRMSYSVEGYKEPKLATEAVLEGLESENWGNPKVLPIVDVTLTGEIGFPNSALEINKIRIRAKEISKALHVRIKNKTTVPLEGMISSNVVEDREELEKKVIEGLVKRDSRYSGRTTEVSEVILAAKRMALDGTSAKEISELISEKIVRQRSGENGK